MTVFLLVIPLLACLAVFSIPWLDVRRIGVFATGITLGLAIVAAIFFDYGRADEPQLGMDVVWIPAIDVHWHLGIDGISLPMVLLTALLGFLALLAVHYDAPSGGSPRAFVGLLLLLEVGMLGTFLALDLIVFFVFFEVVLVPMWFVIAWWGDPHDGPGRRAAATTFLLYTVLGSAVMVIGFLIVGLGGGTFDLVELANARGAGLSRTAQLWAATTIAIGLAVKSPLWPLHSWLPDAHAKAPTVGSVLLAGVLLKMGTYGFVRIWVPVMPDGAREVAPYLAGFAVVGIVYGALACFVQRELKRLIAYSSVGHMGFVLLGVATLSPAGVNGALYAGVAHGLITGLLFFLVGAIKDRHGTGELAELGGGLYARLPRLGGLVVFGAVASLGLPGLAGFWGEMLALFGAFQPDGGLNRSLFLVLMVIAGLGAVLTAAYFLALVRRLCQGEDTVGARLAGVADVTRVEALVWAPLVLLTIVLGLYPKAILAVTDPAVQVVVGMTP